MQTIVKIKEARGRPRPAKLGGGVKGLANLGSSRAFVVKYLSHSIRKALSTDLSEPGIVLVRIGEDVDTMLYFVGGLPTFSVPAYTRLDSRIAWRPAERVELSAVGENRRK